MVLLTSYSSLDKQVVNRFRLRFERITICVLLSSWLACVVVGLAPLDMADRQTEVMIPLVTAIVIRASQEYNEPDSAAAREKMTR